MYLLYINFKTFSGLDISHPKVCVHKTRMHAIALVDDGSKIDVKCDILILCANSARVLILDTTFTSTQRDEYILPPKVSNSKLDILTFVNFS